MDLALAFHHILVVASRLLHPYSTDEKTPKVNGEKILHSEGHPERFTELHEEERGKKEVEVTKRRRGGIKKGESSLASNQFPICSPQSGTLREVHGVP